MNYNCSNLLDMRNLQEQVKKAFCYQKNSDISLFELNCSSDLKVFQTPNFSRKFQKFFLITRIFFLTLGQHNFGNKIPNNFFLWLFSIHICIYGNKLVLQIFLFLSRRLVVSLFIKLCIFVLQSTHKYIEV